MSAITSIDQLDLNKRYSYADYLTWQFKERVELLKGKIFRMSPAPNRKHQRILGDIYGSMWNFWQKDKMNCHLFIAPFDVRLPALKKDDKSIDTVVQPDITVVCDESKLDDQGCVGAPDLVVEVLSPGNSQNEMNHKFELYENAGIQEYWLVDPVYKVISLYHLNEEGEYIAKQPFTATSILRSKVFPKLTLDLSTIFK